jgi:archaellum biogenesis ATPase FlaH
VNPWALQSFVTGLFNLLLGVYILLKGPKRMLNRVFSLFAFSLAIWGISEVGHRVADSPEVAYLWMRGGGIGWCFMASLYFHFVLIFTKRVTFLKRKSTYVFLYLPPLIFLYLFLTTDLIYGQQIVKRSWGYTSLPGNIIWTFFLYYFLQYPLGIYFIADIKKKGSTLEAKQAKPLQIGATVFLVIATITNIAFPFFDVQLPEIGSSMSIILTACTLYAILKHKLFIVELKPEETKRNKQKYILGRGLSYSITEERLDKSYEIFTDQLLHDNYGLCLSKFPPEKVRDTYGLERTPIIWVAFRENENTVSPKDLDAIESIIFDFLNRAARPVILIDCLNEIRLTNGIDRTLNWLKRIEATCKGKNCILLISVNPAIVDKKELAEIAAIGTCPWQLD